MSTTQEPKSPTDKQGSGGGKSDGATTDAATGAAPGAKGGVKPQDDDRPPQN